MFELWLLRSACLLQSIDFLGLNEMGELLTILFFYQVCFGGGFSLDCSGRAYLNLLSLIQVNLFILPDQRRLVTSSSISSSFFYRFSNSFTTLPSNLYLAQTLATTSSKFLLSLSSLSQISSPVQSCINTIEICCPMLYSEQMMLSSRGRKWWKYTQGMPFRVMNTLSALRLMASLFLRRVVVRTSRASRMNHSSDSSNSFLVRSRSRKVKLKYQEQISLVSNWMHSPRSISCRTCMIGTEYWQGSFSTHSMALRKKVCLISPTMCVLLIRMAKRPSSVRKTSSSPKWRSWRVSMNLRVREESRDELPISNDKTLDIKLIIVRACP